METQWWITPCPEERRWWPRAGPVPGHLPPQALTSSTHGASVSSHVGQRCAEPIDIPKDAAGQLLLGFPFRNVNTEKSPGASQSGGASRGRFCHDSNFDAFGHSEKAAPRLCSR